MIYVLMLGFHSFRALKQWIPTADSVLNVG